MISFCLFAISLFISFALSCNLPNVIYYSTNYKSGTSLYNENYYPIGYYNKIANYNHNGYGYSNTNNLYTKPNVYKYVLLFDVNAFHYYFSFYLMFLIYSLSTKLLLILLKSNHTQYNMSKLLKSVIKKRTNVNMNDTYYIPDPDTLDGDRDVSEDGGERDGEQDKCIEEQEQEQEHGGDRSDEDRSDEEKSDGSEGEGEGEGEEGCCECNNENCTYFSIDNECKIKCISCE